MFFNSKRNKRRIVEHEELLDVRLRVGPMRAGRLRLLGAGLSVILLFAAVGLLLWLGGGYFMDRFIYKNEAFAIRQIQVDTDGIISSDAICNWSGVKVGDNLLALDLMNVKRDLESQPCIQFVAVERILPRTLKIRVVEREPIAQTAVMQPSVSGFDKIVYLFDEAGYTMKPLDPSLLTQSVSASFTDGLPMLLGVQAGELQPGVRVDSPQILGALTLLVEFDRSLMSGLASIDRINVSSPEILQVTTSQGAEITFSLDRFDVQLRRWRLIYDQYQKWGKAIASLDLSISNNLPLRWVAANTVQPMQPKVKPPRIKKKNV